MLLKLWAQTTLYLETVPGRSNGTLINKAPNMLFVSHFYFKRNCSQSERSQPLERVYATLVFLNLEALKCLKPALVSFRQKGGTQVFFSVRSNTVSPLKKKKVWPSGGTLCASDVRLKALRILISGRTLRCTTLDNRCCLCNVTSKAPDPARQKILISYCILNVEIKADFLQSVDSTVPRCLPKVPAKLRDWHTVWQTSGSAP